MDLILAPLMGITGPEFRRVFPRHFPGIDRALTPFVSLTEGIQRSRLRFREADPAENRGGIPSEPQFLAKEGVLFREASERLRDSWGHARTNWNIGCPSAVVTSRQRGSGILPFPDRIRAFLEAACAGSGGPGVSVKTRIGFRSAGEWAAVAAVLRDFPLEELTIHPRTGVQHYEGLADREVFLATAGSFPFPVVYNGDVETPGEARVLQEAFPELAGVMLGRGLLKDPFLAGRIRGMDLPAPGSPEFLEALWDFHDDLAEEYLASRCREGRENPGLMTGRMKELVSYWDCHFPPRDGRSRGGIAILRKTRTASEYRETVRALRAGD